MLVGLCLLPWLIVPQPPITLKISKVRDNPSTKRVPIIPLQRLLNLNRGCCSTTLTQCKSPQFTSMGQTISSGPNLSRCTSVVEESSDTSLVSDSSLPSPTHNMLCGMLKIPWWWHGWWTRWKRISVAIICAIPEPKSYGIMSRRCTRTWGTSPTLQAREIRHGGDNVTKYFHSLKQIWQDLDLFNTYKWKSTEDAKHHQQAVEEGRIFQFLAGLNEELDEVCGRIIGRPA